MVCRESYRWKNQELCNVGIVVLNLIRHLWHTVEAVAFWVQVGMSSKKIKMLRKRELMDLQITHDWRWKPHLTNKKIRSCQNPIINSKIQLCTYRLLFTPNSMIFFPIFYFLEFSNQVYTRYKSIQIIIQFQIRAERYTHNIYKNYILCTCINIYTDIRVHVINVVMTTSIYIYREYSKQE